MKVRFGSNTLFLDDDLKRLNRGQTITVNFARYFPNEENLRIIDLRILMYSEKYRKGDIKTTQVRPMIKIKPPTWRVF
ncbi:hypothetical protein HRM2_43890 [Desulforapulum autotrophicum HRM2]|uniref:Uncharacterized protein n=1 Tax=Desulforapulum autotrophicum (strain ATCC 43914 / DSM 3382 / VKM B-1955 / HRM2) TaxID=177437 RepID=C0QE24_DESAH|nr:hypothetical protein HRM2_43890 [Desulforapulum autotrophicum HRM2]